MADTGTFRYRAVDDTGRRVVGTVMAASEAAAFDALRSQGLAPIRLRRGGAVAASAPRRRIPKDRESAEFLGSLADLLQAGADIRTALAILGDRSNQVAVKALGRRLNDDISGGEALDTAFARAFEGRHAFIASMVSAGEASGDLPGGLRRAADILTARLKLREQLVSVLAYPSFVLLSAVAAVFVILLFIVPSIAPLAEDAGATPPLSLRILIACSDALKTNLGLLSGAAAAAAIGAVIMFRLGLARDPLEWLLLDGPMKRTSRAIIFGGFIVSLGAMLTAGAPVTDALRLAGRGVMVKRAQRRLEALVPLVRQGQALSAALASVVGMPASVVRLSAVGESSNALGRMLVRSGQLEEESAVRHIETFGRLAGPALIVVLGLILGVLMAGLLSGVSQVGQAALE